MTGTEMVKDSKGFENAVAVKVEARTTSRVVTPKILENWFYRDFSESRKNGGRCLYRFSSNLLYFFKTSATIGTVELTGLEMTATKAFGQYSVIPIARSLTIPALIYPRKKKRTESV
jgi:hypothetical protein